MKTDQHLLSRRFANTACISYIVSAVSFFTLDISASGTVRPRVSVLTDMENEPGDVMSMVRFLIYSNQWDVEGIIATTSVHQQLKTAVWRIREEATMRQHGAVSAATVSTDVSAALTSQSSIILG